MTQGKPYDNDFKTALVNLHLAGKSQAEICRAYGVSSSALGSWVKKCTEKTVVSEDRTMGEQITELIKRNAQLEEENLILKRASVILLEKNSKEVEMVN